MHDSKADRWLLPRHQTEYPARGPLPEARVHGRREATFLVLAALSLVATTALLALGTSRVVDLPSLLVASGVHVELREPVLIPLGALLLPFSLVATALVCELFGRRRASALNAVGLVAGLAIVGVMRVADLVDGGDAFGSALALAACSVIAHGCHLIVFDRLRTRSYGRQLATRTSASALLALGLGWAVFALVLRSGQGSVAPPMAWDTVLALAIGGAGAAAIAVLVLAIVGGVIGRALAVALRVGHDVSSLDGDSLDAPEDDAEPAGPVWMQPRPAFAEGSVARRLPQALVVEDDEPGAAPVPRRARAASIPPFSSAELRFFREGDEA